MQPKSSAIFKSSVLVLPNDDTLVKFLQLKQFEC